MVHHARCREQTSVLLSVHRRSVAHRDIPVRLSWIHVRESSEGWTCFRSKEHFAVAVHVLESIHGGVGYRDVGESLLSCYYREKLVRAIP